MDSFNQSSAQQKKVTMILAADLITS